jgi:hypothetical protein
MQAAPAFSPLRRCFTGRRLREAHERAVSCVSSPQHAASFPSRSPVAGGRKPSEDPPCTVPAEGGAHERSDGQPADCAVRQPHPRGAVQSFGVIIVNVAQPVDLGAAAAEGRFARSECVPCGLVSLGRVRGFARPEAHAPLGNGESRTRAARVLPRTAF